MHLWVLGGDCIARLSACNRVSQAHAPIVLLEVHRQRLEQLCMLPLQAADALHQTARGVLAKEVHVAAVHVEAVSLHVLFVV